MKPSLLSRFEKHFFRPVELWAVYLLAIGALSLIVTVAWGVRHQLMGGPRLGSAGDWVLTIADIPSRGWRVFRFFLLPESEDLVSAEQRFGVDSKFEFADPPGVRTDVGYLLLNRYDGDIGFSVSELWDLRSQELVHRWVFSGVDDLWRQTALVSQIKYNHDSSATRFRNFHAALDDRGELLTHALSPLVRADVCSSLSLFNRQAIYHHSIEPAGRGSYWVPSLIEPKSVDLGSPYFKDDGLTLLSSEGEVLFQKSVAKLLLEFFGKIEKLFLGNRRVILL